MNMKEKLEKFKITLPKFKFDPNTLLEQISNPLIAVVVGLIISDIFLAIMGFDAIAATQALLRGSIGSQYAIASTLSKSVPLMLSGLAFAVAARAKIFNIGTEGQFYMGALIAVIIGSMFTVWSPVHILIIIIVAFLAGGLLALPAALLKVYRGVNEVITTIMLNWIAYYLVKYIASHIIYDPNKPYKTVDVSHTATFPSLISKTDLTFAIFISILFAILVYFYMWLTVDGYEIRAVGLNPHAAEYAGINVKLTTIKALVVSGGLAGIGGALHIMATVHYFDTALTYIMNYGFDGITVSLLGRNHPIGIIFSAIFLGGLRAASPAMQIFAKIPKEIVVVSQGIIILIVAIPSIIDLFRKQEISVEEIIKRKTANPLLEEKSEV